MSSLAMHNDQTINSSPGNDSPADCNAGSESSLLAEYTRMLLMMHAACCGLVWTAVLIQQPTAASGIIAAAWVVLRASGGPTWRWYFPLITAGLAIAVSQFRATAIFASWSSGSGGPFGASILLTMLMLIASADLMEIARWLRNLVLVPKRQTSAQSFLMQHGLRSLLWGTVGFMMMWSIAVPLVQETIYQNSPAASDPKFAMDRMTLPQNMLFKFSESMSGMWFFVVGSCVGSFLNVVIYRVPAGISVLAKASHCPVCRTPIAGRDNLPLIGWLKLQGRCRNCQTSISSRYPAVELTIGLMFLLLYFVELISGGTNLPGRTPNHYAGVLWILFYTKWDLLTLYLFHCFVLCAVFSWVMMGRDGHRVPVKAAVITLALVVTAALIWPHLLPWTDGGILSLVTGDTAMPRPALTADRLLSGAVVGLLSGWLVSRVCGVPCPSATWLLIGVAFGWQAVVGISVLYVVARLLLNLAGMLSTESGRSYSVNISDDASLATSPGWAATAWWLLPVVLLIHHCFWRQLAITSGGVL